MVNWARPHIEGAGIETTLEMLDEARRMALGVAKLEAPAQ
jgi:hypothetical protein